MPSYQKRLLAIAAAVALAPVYAIAQQAEPVQAAPIPAADYQRVTLAIGSAEVGEPMSLAVLPNRSVLHTARDGTVRVTDVNGNTRVAGRIPVYTHDEEGMQGVAVDPDFATNRFIWLYYSPVLNTPGGDAPITGTQADWDRWRGQLNLSRFTLNSDDTINLASERVVLTVPADRGICCHVGGDIDFDCRHGAAIRLHRPRGRQHRAARPGQQHVRLR